MFFELNEITYKIKFYRTGKTTVAELQQVTGDSIVSLGEYGVSNPHYKDVFQKKIGRKRALENLLKGLSNPDTEPSILLSKEDRAKIWEAYFERHKK